MIVKPLLTAEELYALPEVPGKRFELVHGELIEVPAAGMQHGLIAGFIYRLLAAFALERGLGYAFGDGVGYIIRRAPDLVRVPDVSFIAQSRVRARGIPAGFWPGAPDLAVEVVSPNDRADEVRAKAREYLAAGARLVWIIWTQQRTASVYTADGAVRELGPDDELEGGDVLPGFRVRLAELFASIPADR